MSNKTNRPLADIQFIADFAAYARKRGDAAYDYADTYCCACAQFLLAAGRMDRRGGVGGTFWDDGRTFHNFPDGMDLALLNAPHTFSALADRLEALIADAPIVELAK